MKMDTPARTSDIVRGAISMPRLAILGLLLGLMSCERKLDQLGCPCVPNYTCCKVDDRCYPDRLYPEETPCAAGGGNGKRKFPSGAGIERATQAAGGSLGRTPSGRSTAGQAGRAGADAGDGAKPPPAGAGGNSSVEKPADGPRRFPRFCSPSGWCGARHPFHAVWGNDARDVWVSSSITELTSGCSLSHWDGSEWTNHDDEQRESSYWIIEDIWGSAKNDVWFVGWEEEYVRGGSAIRHGTIQHWDGVAWTTHHPGTDALRAVWGSASDDVWGVGSLGFVVHWDGSEWTVVSIPFTDDLNGVWGRADDDVWVVGAKGAIRHWDGVEWEKHEVTDADLNDVWSSPSGHVWVTGDNGVLLHWSGHEWNIVTDPAIPTAGDLRAVFGHEERDVWVAASDGSLARWDGSTWEPAIAAEQPLHAVWTAANGEVWAVGDAASSVHFDRDEWRASPAPIEHDLFSIWGSHADDAWAVGEGGAIVHWDGVRWSPVASPTDRELRFVFGVSPDDVWAVGDAIAHFDGEAWSLVLDSTAPGLNAVWASASDAVWAVGDGGVTLHYDGEAWSSIATPVSADLTSIWGSAPNEVFAVGRGNVSLHWDGARWSAIPSPGDHYYTDHLITGTATDNVWMAGWFLDETMTFNFVWGRKAESDWVVESGVYGAVLDGANRPAIHATPDKIWMVTGLNNEEIWYFSDDGLAGDGSGATATLHGIWSVGSDGPWVAGARGTLLHKEFTFDWPPLDPGQSLSR